LNILGRSLAWLRGPEQRMAGELGNTNIPFPYSGWFSYAGEPVTITSAAGLPAVTAAVRLISESVGTLPLHVYNRSGEERTRAESSWQWRLLHERPNEDQSSFDFLTGIAGDIEWHGNHYSQKVRGFSEGKLEALLPLDPATVSPKRDKDTGEKIFKVKTRDGVQEYDKRDILHVRGFTFNSSDLVGLSPIQVARHALGNALALQRFQGEHFENGAPPGDVIKAPQTVTEEQAQRWISLWEARHKGAGNRGKTAILGGGFELEDRMAFSFVDAQFIEAMEFGIEDVERIFGLPPGELSSGVDDSSNINPEQRALRLLTFTLLPRLRRIERAMAADLDLFPRPGPQLFPEFLTDGFARADLQTRYTAYKDARQGSWITANEIRRRENLPPKEGGDEIQVTPVGGAPNEMPSESDEDEEE
jgi:HK97 family phage portal protein